MKSLKEIIDGLIKLLVTYDKSGVMTEEERKVARDLIFEYITYYEYDLSKEINEEDEDSFKCPINDEDCPYYSNGFCELGIGAKDECEFC